MVGTNDEILTNSNIRDIVKQVKEGKINKTDAFNELRNMLIKKEGNEVEKLFCPRDPNKPVKQMIRFEDDNDDGDEEKTLRRVQTADGNLSKRPNKGSNHDHPSLTMSIPSNDLSTTTLSIHKSNNSLHNNYGYGYGHAPSPTSISDKVSPVTTSRLEKQLNELPHPSPIQKPSKIPKKSRPVSSIATTSLSSSTKTIEKPIEISDDYQFQSSNKSYSAPSTFTGLRSQVSRPNSPTEIIYDDKLTSSIYDKKLPKKHENNSSTTSAFTINSNGTSTSSKNRKYSDKNLIKSKDPYQTSVKSISTKRIGVI
mmetsp:Transcript_6699/g.7013  ORF Transcript_6699/g.7013 Transcript_6699/m.7013 type:complete len:311 (+) Transcript_6699:129-1061(+)